MDAAARQRQNDGFLKLVSGECFGKPPPCLGSEWHHSLLCGRLLGVAKVSFEPVPGVVDNGLQGPALSEEVAGTGNDLQRLWSSISTAWPSSGSKDQETRRRAKADFTPN